MTTSLLELPTHELHGSPRQMGEQFGEATRDQIRELFDLRLAAAIDFAGKNSRNQFQLAEVLRIVRQCLPITQKYDLLGYEEFLGIAHAAALTPEQLFITQGLTDLRDVLSHHRPDAAETFDPASEGCTSFIATRERTADAHLLLGQTWDLNADNLPYVCLVHRRPTDGSPHSWSLTLTGCLTLIGLNSAGIAVGNTNLRTTDSRPGLQYLSVLHRAIRSTTFHEAVAAIGDAPRSAAHYFYVADAHNHAVGLECSATQCVPLSPQDDLLVHCNHAFTPAISALQDPIATQSTFCRQPRMTHLLTSAPNLLTTVAIQSFFADHDGAENAICRHDSAPLHVATNACVILSPETRQLHACRGQSHVGTWRIVQL